MVLPLALHGIIITIILSFLSIQIPSEYFGFLAVQIYSCGFYLHLIMSGPDLLGGYGDRFGGPLTHLLGSPGEEDIAGHAGHGGVAFWNSVNQKGLWEAGFAVLSG